MFRVFDQRAQHGAGARFRVVLEQSGVLDVDALLRVHAGIRVLEREVPEQRFEAPLLHRDAPPEDRFGPVLDARAQHIEPVVERRIAFVESRDRTSEIHQLDVRGRAAGVDALAAARHLPHARQQVLQQGQMVRVVGDRLGVAQQALENRVVEHDFRRQGIRSNRPLALRRLPLQQTQEALRRRLDRLAQFRLVEPAHQVRGLVDRVGQFEVGGAIVEVLAAHSQHDVAALMRIEKMIDHALDHQPGVLAIRVGRMEQFLELVDHEQQPSVGRIGAGRHGELFGIRVDEPREAGVLPEPRGDLFDTLGVGRLGATRLQQPRELPGKSRDRRVPGLARLDLAGIRARRTDHRNPEVASPANAEAAQLGHHTGMDQRRLARPRAADHGHELGTAQMLDDLAHLARAAEQQR